MSETTSPNYLSIKPDLTIFMNLDLKRQLRREEQAVFDFSFSNSFMSAGWSYHDRADAVARLVNEFTTKGYFFENDHVGDFGIVLDHSSTEERDVYTVYLREDVINPFVPTVMVYDPMKIFDTPSCLIRDALAAAFLCRTIVLSNSYEATVTGKGLLSDVLEFRTPKPFVQPKYRLRSTPEEMGDIKPVTLPKGYTEVYSNAVKPTVGLDYEAHKVAMRALFLREQRAKTILAELQAAEAMDGLYTEGASKAAEALREAARTWS